MAEGMRLTSPFLYEGPADCFEAVQRALAWVVHPHSGQALPQDGAVRAVRIAGTAVVVDLALPPGGITQVVAEDLQAELFDHLQGRWRVEVRLVPPAPPVLA